LTCVLPSPSAPDLLVQLRLLLSKQNGQAGSFERAMTADLLVLVFDSARTAILLPGARQTVLRS